MCNENEKGIKSKTCRPCAIRKNLSGKSIPVRNDASIVPGWSKAESEAKPEAKPAVKPAVKPEVESEAKPEVESENLIGKTRKNGMFYI